METEHEREHRAIEARNNGNRARLLELAHEINNIAVRVHELEDKFEVEGIVGKLSEDVHRLNSTIQQLLEHYHDRVERSRHTDTEYSDYGADEPPSDTSSTAVGEGE